MSDIEAFLEKRWLKKFYPQLADGGLVELQQLRDASNDQCIDWMRLLERPGHRLKFRLLCEELRMKPLFPIIQLVPISDEPSPSSDPAPIDSAATQLVVPNEPAVETVPDPQVEVTAQSVGDPVMIASDQAIPVAQSTDASTDVPSSTPSTADSVTVVRKGSLPPPLPPATVDDQASTASSSTDNPAETFPHARKGSVPPPLPVSPVRKGSLPPPLPTESSSTDPAQQTPGIEVTPQPSIETVQKAEESATDEIVPEQEVTQATLPVSDSDSSDSDSDQENSQITEVTISSVASSHSRQPSGGSLPSSTPGSANHSRRGSFSDNVDDPAASPNRPTSMSIRSRLAGFEAASAPATLSPLTAGSGGPPPLPLPGRATGTLKDRMNAFHTAQQQDSASSPNRPEIRSGTDVKSLASSLAGKVFVSLLFLILVSHSIP